ncbi:MAG: tetratricopeptide repeat protein [Ignavibacteria bacterium]
MMKRLLLLFLILISSVFAQNSNDYEKKLKQSLDLVFNFKFNEAENHLSNLSRLRTDDARPLLYLSNIYVWRFIGDKRKSDFEKFENLSKETIERAESILNKNKDDRWAYFCLSSIYGYRALMFFMDRQYIDGLWAAKKSISWTDDLIELDPAFYDGYLWRGLFSFSLNQVPSSLRGLLSIVGLKGDVRQGLKDIQLVATRGNFARVEAMYFLSQFYSASLNDNQKAFNLLKELASKYPDNELFVYSAAVELIKLHRIDEAKNYLQKIISNNSVEISAVKDLSYFLIGDCNFYQNNFSEAISNYNIFIQKYEQDQYKPTAYFRTALSYYFLNNRGLSKINFEKAISVNSKISEDKFHQRMAKKIINSNFDETILKIFYAWNFLRSGQFSSAINQFDEILKDNIDDNKRIIALYLKGLSYYKLNDTVNARRFLRDVVKINSNEELWAKAFALLYLARLEFNSKNYTTADNYISKILEFDDFDFESSVKSQAKNLRERINNNF